MSTTMCKGIQDHDDPRYGCDCHLQIGYAECDGDKWCRCAECEERRRDAAEYSRELYEESLAEMRREEAAKPKPEN